eukprot:gene13415-15807_t
MDQINYTKKIKETKGIDSEGRNVYSSLDDLWQKELTHKDGSSTKDEKWYSLADKYWSTVEPTVDGMLGGLSYVSDADVETSTAFLKEMFTHKQRPIPLGHVRALDCGAGIGRVTRHLLLPLFDTVDLVEQCTAFIDEAKVLFKDEKRVEEFNAVGLQDFIFREERKYDVVWIQWVIGHLHDQDLILFIKRCMAALAPGGMICIKDNTTKKEAEFIMDKEDNSVTRSDQHLCFLFESAGCKVIKSMLQPNFPKSLFPVRLYAIEPIGRLHMKQTLRFQMDSIAHN